MHRVSTFSPPVIKRLIAGIVLEFGPIFIFLATFPHFHIYKATSLLMIATIVSTILTYVFQKRLPYIALYVALLTIAFGYLTLMHREPKFIQMRDTLYDLTFVVTLLFGLMINVSFLKIAFHSVIPMTKRAWHKLTYAWVVYLLSVAFLNEYVRRTQSLQDWFEFKWSMVFVTIAFGCAALYFCYEKGAEEKE